MLFSAGVAKVSYFLKIVSAGLQYFWKYHWVGNEQKPLSFEKKNDVFSVEFFFLDHYVTKKCSNFRLEKNCAYICLSGGQGKIILILVLRSFSE